MSCTDLFSERMEKCKDDSHTQTGQDQTPLRTWKPGQQSVVNSRKMLRKAGDWEALLLPRDHWSNTIPPIWLHCPPVQSGRLKDCFRIRWAQQKLWTLVLSSSTGHSGGVRQRLAPRNSRPALETKMSPKHLQHGEWLLRDRTAHVTLGNSFSSKDVTKGCPQGSVSRPTTK